MPGGHTGVRKRHNPDAGEPLKTTAHETNLANTGEVRARRGPYASGRRGAGWRAGCHIVFAPPRTCIDRGAVPLAGDRRPRRPALALQDADIVAPAAGRGRPAQTRGSAPQTLRHSRYWENYVALGWRAGCCDSPVNEAALILGWRHETALAAAEQAIAMAG